MVADEPARPMEWVAYQWRPGTDPDPRPLRDLTESEGHVLLLERGWTLELSCDDDAIWVAAAAADGGAPATARLETPRWWLPSRSGRALAIAEELATALATKVEGVP